ncbi:MAG: hypothetical protein DRO52_05695 [Candidatus Hecatellales archaeon]|nr:MAG: hypothetical protein DRO52_05695 [Candidatus Hecatellales archaeon]
MDRREIVKVLEETVARFDGVQLAFLFGSHAEGRATPTSDIDIAVLIREPKLIANLTAEISKALGFPEDKISILNFEEAGPRLKLRILTRGVKLLDRGAYEEKLRKEVRPEIVELLEDERAGFQAWLRGNPIDESIVRRIFVQLTEDVEDLRGFLKGGRKALSSDKNLRKAFERTLQTAIEGALDLLRHVVSGLNLGIAEYYRDYVEIGREKGVISPRTAENLLELIPTRHALVHRYRETSLSKLWLQAKKAVEAIPSLQGEVKKYLQKALNSSKVY